MARPSKLTSAVSVDDNPADTTPESLRDTERRAAAFVVGRKTLFTEWVADAIVGMVERGIPPVKAGLALGISADTMREWLRRGEDRDDRPTDEAFAAFAVRIHFAEQVYMDGLVSAVRHEANLEGGWRAAAWLLEHRWPELWGKRKHAQPPQLDVNILVQLMGNVAALESPGERAQVVEQIAQVFGLPAGSQTPEFVEALEARRTTNSRSAS